MTMLAAELLKSYASRARLGKGVPILSLES